MQLSDAEKKMVARLRKRKQSFARWRWWLLLVHIFSMGVGCYGLWTMWRCFEMDPTLAIGEVAFFAPIAYLFLYGGLWMMVDTLINWHGRPEADLLLRLMEDSQNDA
jgi:hypothetical protein